MYSCNWCVYEPKEGGNYSTICGECKRFYADKFEKKSE